MKNNKINLITASLFSILFSLLVVPSSAFAGSAYKETISYLKDRDSMVNCSTMRPDRIRLLRWHVASCVSNKAKFTHAFFYMIYFAKKYDAVKGKSARSSQYYQDRFLHFKDVLDEADRNLSRNNCSYGCY